MDVKPLDPKTAQFAAINPSANEVLVSVIFPDQ